MVKSAFPRKLRLLTPNHFSFVFQKPQRTSTLHITILGRFNDLGYPRVGLVVAKRYVKQAHERNRIKRLIRESFRLHQHFLPNVDFVIIAKKGIADLDNYFLTETLEELWHCQFQNY